MMAKGAQWLKIDMHFKDSAFCTSQGVSNPDGCFVLLHDTPSASVRYNTSDDVISYISTHRKYFFNPRITIYIALCFKSSPFDVCSPSGEGFLRLLRDFQSKTNRLIDEGANLAFVVDGSLSMTETCTKDAFEPWVATWQGIPWSALNSNNASLGYDRLQVYDLPALSYLIFSTAELNWGKFLTSPWPLLIWEPSNEADIVLFSNIYTTWATQNPSIRTLPDYRFAINIDPVQFQVYTGTAAKTTWRELRSATAVNPKVVALPHTPYMPYPLNFLLLQQEGNLATYAILTAKQFQGAIAELARDLPVPSPLLASLAITSASASTYKFAAEKVDHLIAIGDSDSQLHFLRLPAGSSALQPLGHFSNFGNTPTYTSFALLASSFANSTTSPSYYPPLIARLHFSVKPSKPGCGWQLDIWNFTFSQPGSITGRSIATTCLQGLPPTSPHDSQADDSGSLSASIAGYMPNSWTSEGVLTISQGNIVYGSHFYFTMSGFAGPLVSTTNIIPIGVGSNTSLSLVCDEFGAAFVHEVHGDGFCFNTETRNKQPSPTLCELRPQATPGVLNYNYAPLSHWKAHFHSQQSSTTPLLTSCGEEVLHGTYDQGHNPSVALAAMGSKIGVVEVHEGWRANDRDVSECGAPIMFSASGGVVLDSWPLANPQWD